MAHATSRLAETLARTAVRASDGRPLAAPGRSVAGEQRAQASLIRVGIFGLFGNGNAGNDGTLEAMLRFLRRAMPDAELTCICACAPGGPQKVAADFRVAAIPLAFPKPANLLLCMLDKLSFQGPRQLASWIRAVARLRKLDLLIVPGTGILGEFRDRPLGMPLALYGWCLAARLCGTRIAFVSVGAGPIDHRLSRWLIKSAAGMAQYRSYRDANSKDFMKGIGVDICNDTVYPDLAFKLPAPASTRRQGTEGGPITVGVGLMTYLGTRNDSNRGAAIYAAYLEKITNFVLWLLDQGHLVRILMGAEADRCAVADLVAGVAIRRPDLTRDRLIAESVDSLHDLMRQIAETDVVVATRFHNVVCALKLGKPTVSIGYGDKHDALMAEMGVGRFCQHVEHLNVDLLIEQFTQLMLDRQRYERSIRGANLLFQQRLERQDSILAARFFQR